MIADALTVLAWILLFGSAVGCLYLAGAAWAVRRLLGRRESASAAAPAVSVLKPLCGEDPGLYDNLLSFCRQDYPVFQLVFGVRDPHDPAIAVVRRLMAACPDADIALVVDERRAGSNLKVANLINMLPAARHGLIVLADSDMRVRPNYLATITAPLARPEIGLVTCLYRGIESGGFWSKLAAIHINHEFLPQAALGEVLGAGSGCFGATIALRRESLDRLGGFASLADTLADDHALGAGISGIGGKIHLSSHLVDDIVVEPSLGALIRHELRWARTVRLLAPAGYAGSVATHPVALAALAAATGRLPAAGPAMLALALLCRAAAVRVTDRALELPATPLLLLPVRDLLSFGLFLASFLTRTVAWRDSRYHVGPRGQLTFDGDRSA